MSAELLCLRPGPGGETFAGFEARARAAVARRWAAQVALRFLANGDPGWPPGVFASARLPTLVVSAGGRVLAQAVGDLPGTEIDVLLERALLST
jgi:hypothetical protein